MQSWIETPALIKHAELQVIHGEGTTYKVVAAYDYKFAGQKLKGERVGMGSGSDSIGSFQHVAYQELKRHRDQKKPFHCYVNPRQPSEAVLYRHLRGEMLSFYTGFATVFGSVGLGLMTVVATAARRKPVMRKEGVPADAPWKVRADWESGLIPASSVSSVAIVMLAVLALYWSIAILPLVLKLPEVLAQGKGFWSWTSLAFPLIDAALVVCAFLPAHSRAQVRRIDTAISKNSRRDWRAIGRSRAHGEADCGHRRLSHYSELPGPGFRWRQSDDKSDLARRATLDGADAER